VQIGQGGNGIADSVVNRSSALSTLQMRDRIMLIRRRLGNGKHLVTVSTYNHQVGSKMREPASESR
jgi:hypothetical protein